MGYYLIRLTCKPLNKKKYNIKEVVQRNSDVLTRSDNFNAIIDRAIKKVEQNTIPPYPSSDQISVEERIRAEEENDQKKIDKVLSDSRTTNEELIYSNDLAEENIGEDNKEQTEEKKNVFKMLFKPNPYKKEKKKKKQKNEDEEAKEKKKFSIWEEVPEEPRDPMQLEAAEIINQDGYYNTVLPTDSGEIVKEKKEFNWKIPMLILIGIASLIMMGYVMFV